MSKGRRMFRRAIEITDRIATLVDLEDFVREEYWDNCLETDCLEYHEDCYCGCEGCYLEEFFKSLELWRREDEIEMLNLLKIK